MNSQKPADLGQKVQYLHEKLNLLYQKSKQKGQFQLRMKFTDLIDSTIEKMYRLGIKQGQADQIIRKTYDKYYSAQQNQSQRKRIQQEKNQLNNRIRNLNEQERNLELERLRLDLQNQRIVKQKMSKEYESKQKELKIYIFDMQKKTKLLQRETQRLVNMNSAQLETIQRLKNERKRAQEGEIHWRQKYDSQIGVLQNFKSRGSKYAYRPEAGLSIDRIFTNNTTAKHGCQTFFVCDLPLRFKVLKIAYGIRVGMIRPDRQIQFFKEIGLFEKEDMVLSVKQGVMELQYVKRKVKNKFEKYNLKVPQIVIMLFGKGDSVSIDQTN